MIRYKEAPGNTYSLLPPEQQLRLLQEEMEPCVSHLGRWHGTLWLFPLASLFILMSQWLWGVLALMGALGGVALTYRERRHWNVTRRQAEVLAVSVRGADAVPAVIDFARWQGKEATECHKTLERLLPRLDTLSARQLSEAQRSYLRQCAENQEPSVEVAVAALLVLASAGDSATVPIARQLAASSSSQRIRDAAQLCLEELHASE